jgi:hypothetical protein
MKFINALVSCLLWTRFIYRTDAIVFSNFQLVLDSYVLSSLAEKKNGYKKLQHCKNKRVKYERGRHIFRVGARLL